MPPRSPFSPERVAVWLLAAALAGQMLIFGAGAWFHRHGWLYNDNFYYETPAWNLVSGHGFTIDRTLADDPFLTAPYLARHPAADPRYVPATTLPPGYGFFLAAVYAVAGRSQGAAVVANGLLLVTEIIALWLLLRRRGWGVAAWATMAFILCFPTWAFWASVLMSDTLHCALLALFALVWFRDAPSPRRAVAAGVLLGLASLVRPYALLLPAALVAWYYLAARVAAFAPRYLAIVTLVAWSLVAAWTARNYYEFGKVIPVTSMGLGKVLWNASYPTPFFADASTVREVRADEAALDARGLGEWHYHDVNAALTRIAVTRIRQHPFDYVVGCAQRVLRLWISAVAEGVPRIVIWGFLLVQLVMLAAMLPGLWLARRSLDPVLAGSAVIVVYYWLFFLPFGAEARSTLPARGFAFIVAGAAIGRLRQLRRQPS